jgi:hypothetical protein
MADEKNPTSKPKSTLPKNKSAAVAMTGKAAKNMREVEKKLLSGYWDTEIPLDKKKVRDLVQTAAKQAGIRPETLYASSYQEGLRNAQYIGTDQAYGEEMSPDDDYPVNGFFQMGVDTFGDAAERLKKKGYIPQDFDYQPYKATNEKSQDVNSGLFKTVQDGLIAKAAMMRDLQDQVSEYASKKGLKVDGDELDYLTMAGFNGGFGRVKQMVDEITTQHRGDAKAYVRGGKTSLTGIHKNISPRMRYMEIMREVMDDEKSRSVMAKSVGAPAENPGQLRLGSPLLAIIKGKSF